MKYLFCIICLAFLLSCNSKTKKEEVNLEKVYDMYESSEMAILMNQMYEQNLKIKKEIIEGKTPTEFPSNFLKIHTAELSNFKNRNERFQAFSTLFIEAEKDVFNAESLIPVEVRFNNAVGLCISCHQTECTGPIPRIKKLLIK